MKICHACEVKRDAEKRKKKSADRISYFVGMDQRTGKGKEELWVAFGDMFGCSLQIKSV